jgi:hypothetical protein
VSIPGRVIEVPRRPRLIAPMPTPAESLLCIGSSFVVAATNGRDPSRRISILGFCQSTDVLHEAVEETVAMRGGEILERALELRSGLHEALK